MAYFRACDKPGRSYPTFDITFCKEVYKKVYQLHLNGALMFKSTQQSHHGKLINLTKSSNLNTSVS